MKSVSFTVPKGQVFGLLGKEKYFQIKRVDMDFMNEFILFCWFLRSNFQIDEGFPMKD